MAKIQYVLPRLQLEKLAKEWLSEDTPNFDFAGAVVGNKKETFHILFKSRGVIAGIPFADAIFSQLGLKSKWIYDEGTVIQNPITDIGYVSGAGNDLLLAERVVLNVMSRACGVATTAFDLSQKLKNANWNGVLSGTRKTTPGFRLVEKYALLVGGVDTHRYDLSSMVMLKDNHVLMSGSIGEAINNAKKVCGFSRKIEVECQSLEEALEAAIAGCDIIMLDNFSAKELSQTAEVVKKNHPNILIEASGGISSDNILDYASPYVDIISSSSLIQGYKTMDISMKALKPTIAIVL